MTVGVVAGMVAQVAGVLIWSGLSATAALLYVASRRHGIWLARPERDRETARPQAVDESRYRWALANGASLGSAFSTRVGFALIYTLPLITGVVDSLLFALTIWFTYGVLRSTMPLLWLYRRSAEGFARISAERRSLLAGIDNALTITGVSGVGVMIVAQM